MNCLKNILVLIFISLSILLPQKVYAGEVSNAVDKTISFTAKTTYYLTKYTLKTGWFVVKKTTKGAVAITKGVFNGTKDAFSSSSNIKPKTNTKPKTRTINNSVNNVNKQNNIYTLPPVPRAVQ